MDLRYEQTSDLTKFELHQRIKPFWSDCCIVTVAIKRLYRILSPIACASIGLLQNTACRGSVRNTTDDSSVRPRIDSLVIKVKSRNRNAIMKAARTKPYKDSNGQADRI